MASTTRREGVCGGGVEQFLPEQGPTRYQCCLSGTTTTSTEDGTADEYRAREYIGSSSSTILLCDTSHNEPDGNLGEGTGFDQNYHQYAYRKNTNTTSCRRILGLEDRGPEEGKTIYLPNLMAKDGASSKQVREKRASELERVTGIKYTPPLTMTGFTPPGTCEETLGVMISYWWEAVGVLAVDIKAAY